MTLIVPAPDWRFAVDNMQSTPNNLSFGTAMTAGANNADGTAVSLLSALAHDVEMVGISVSAFSGVDTVSSVLMDLLIDPAGGTSWAELIPDLMIGYSVQVNLLSTTLGNGMPLWYWFPIWIKAGSSVGAMARAAHSSTVTGRVVIFAFGGNRNPGSLWCGQKVTSVGINPSSSQGTSHTAGASGSYSSWANLGSTLATDGYAYQWAVQGEIDSTSTSTASSPYHFQFGYSSTKIGPTIVKGISNNECGMVFPATTMWHRFPAGTQLQVRGTAMGSTPQPLDAAAYIVS